MAERSEAVRSEESSQSSGHGFGIGEREEGAERMVYSRTLRYDRIKTEVPTQFKT